MQSPAQGLRKNNGYTVAREYVYEAESGHIADRSQFCWMIEDGGKASAPFQVILGPTSARKRNLKS